MDIDAGELARRILTDLDDSIDSLASGLARAELIWREHAQAPTRGHVWPECAACRMAEALDMGKMRQAD